MIDTRWTKVDAFVAPYEFMDDHTVFYICITWLDQLFYYHVVVANNELEDMPELYGLVLDEMVRCIDARIKSAVSCLN
jgi:hypothetical protein